MLEKYDQFAQRKKNLDNQMDSQKKKFKKSISGLKRQKIALKMSQLRNSFNQFTAGQSNYN